MALLSQIAPDDCIQEYEQSASEHQAGGLILLADGVGRGIEMMALSAEMLLKAAYFRHLGYTPTRPIGFYDLKDAQSDFLSLNVVSSQGQSGLHDIQYLAAGLIAVRQNGLPARAYGPTNARRSYAAVAASPVAVLDQGELMRCARRLMTNWFIGGRYRSLSRAAKQDLEDVFDDAVGILRLYDTGRI